MIGPLQFDRPLDLARMRRERHARLVDAMREHAVDALVLLGQSNVGYATGTRVPAADQARAIHRRPVAVVTADSAAPHVFTWSPEGAPPELPDDHVHPGVLLELDEGVPRLLDVLPGGTLALDELTMPLRAALAGRDVVDASTVVTAAKVVKTADEIECIRRAQAINEAAIVDVHEMLAPGVRGTELTGRLLRRAFELGATGNTVDPVWQVMPPETSSGSTTASRTRAISRTMATPGWSVARWVDGVARSSRAGGKWWTRCARQSSRVPLHAISPGRPER